MSSFHFFVAVALLSLQRVSHVSSCDMNCADGPVFSPSRVVVKHGDPVSVTCYGCRSSCPEDLVRFEKSVGDYTKNGTTIFWTLDRITQWGTSAICLNSNASYYQCCSTLSVTVYKPPDSVSISFLGLQGLMTEGLPGNLQCEVQNVAPAGKLAVTFYRGQTQLGRLQSNNTAKEPVTEVFALSITPSKEDEGVQYWCEAKLELGPEGPQRPPLMTSQNKIDAVVFYKPVLQGQLPRDPITVTVGYPLRLNCSAVGNPSPSYTWTVLPAGVPLSNGSVLTIESVAYEHEGQYNCSVTNSVGAITVTYSVVVKASITPYIIAAVVGVCVLIAIILIGVVHLFKQRRTGYYNLMDVLRLKPRHVPVPTAE